MSGTSIGSGSGAKEAAKVISLKAERSRRRQIETKTKQVVKADPDLEYAAARPLPEAPDSDDPEVWAQFGKTYSGYEATKTTVQNAMVKMRDTVFAMGRVFLAAKTRIPHGEWQRMFEDHEQPVASHFPFSVNVAQRYMAIARDPVLTNPAHAQALPPSWATLYELTKVPPDQLTRAIQNKKVTPEMERKDATLLVPKRHFPKTRQKQPSKALVPRTIADVQLALRYVRAKLDILAKHGWDVGQAKPMVERLLDWVREASKKKAKQKK
jgi:hypothetical protein